MGKRKRDRGGEGEVSPVMKGKARLTPVSRAANILLSRLSFFMYTFQQTQRASDKLEFYCVLYYVSTLKKVK